MSDDIHEIYAVRYAHHDRQSPENFLFGDPHDILQPLAYFVWAIVGPHGTFIVDTGFDEPMARKRGRTIVKPIAEGLKSIGIQPDAVQDIIVTHLHYDHCGNHDVFPQARYHLQGTEIAYSTGRYMCHPVMRIPFEVDDVVAMVRKVFAGRVVFHAPVTTGSERDPLPIGTWKVTTIQVMPKFNYNPDLFWDANPGHSKATIQSGPNNPVGVAWIDLTKEHYGIHGTPEPANIGHVQSHGCVRLTNWDVTRVMKWAQPGTPVVFRE